MIPVYNPPDLVVGDSYDALVLIKTDTATGVPVPYPDGAGLVAEILDGTQLIYRWSSADGTASLVANVISLAPLTPAITRNFPVARNARFAIKTLEPGGVERTRFAGTVRLIEGLPQ